MDKLPRPLQLLRVALWLEVVQAPRRPGRPSTRADLAALIVRMARENPRWGYTRLRGPMRHLGHEIGRSTAKRILDDHGIDPAPERELAMPWNTFLRAQPSSEPDLVQSSTILRARPS